MPETNVAPVTTAEIVAALPDKERSAYGYFLRSGQTELSADLSAELQAAFNLGATCDEIRKARQGLSLGQIVHARVRDRWDEQREVSIQRLRVDAPALAERSQLESVEFFSKMLAVAHRKYGPQLDLYLATGQEIHLVGTPFEKMSVRLYREILDGLARATGQDQKKTVKVTGGITVTPVRPGDISSAAASEALARFHK